MKHGGSTSRIKSRRSAIRGWDRRNVYYFHLLTSLAKHYGFPIEAVQHTV